MPHTFVPNLQRETLRAIAQHKSTNELRKELALLRIAFKDDSTLLNNFLKQLVHVNRIFPTHWPAQASARWSTWNPPITNWPRACINQKCQATLRNEQYAGDYLGYIEHEWEDDCWSVRDILLPDDDEVLMIHDHDNIEGKIHDLIVNDTQAIQAHREGYDLHTITCCNIFNYHLPLNLKNPHTYCECDDLPQARQDFKGYPLSTRSFFDPSIPLCIHHQWRKFHNWQGKDTRVRVLSKNFNHGSKYTKNKFFVRRIKGIEKYGVNYDRLVQLADTYIKSKSHSWRRKLEIMDSIQQSRIARSLYGFRRKFYDSSDETGREGFSHMISATVSDYNNITIIKMHEWLGEEIRILHNAHDGDKFAIKQSFIAYNYDGCPEDKRKKFITEAREIIERPIEYQGRSLIMTAGIKLTNW